MIIQLSTNGMSIFRGINRGLGLKLHQTFILSTRTRIFRRGEGAALSWESIKSVSSDLAFFPLINSAARLLELCKWWGGDYLSVFACVISLPVGVCVAAVSEC